MLKREEKVIIVGSRCSELALFQTNWVINRLKTRYPDYSFIIKKVSTIGDKILDVSLSKIGTKSLFTKELDNVIANYEAHFIVHSLKDVPTVMPESMVIGCICERHSPMDAVVMSKIYMGHTLSTLPPGSMIGSSSVRRCALLKRHYPHLNFESIRGNLNTRLAKLDGTHPNTSKKYDAIILAEAGITRLGWDERISEVLNCLPYAVGQGALACQCRENDDEILSMLSTIHHETTCLQTIAERAFMNRLDGGCSTPIAVKTLPMLDFEGNHRISYLELYGSVLSTDGIEMLEHSLAINLPFTFNHRKRKNSFSDFCPSTSSDTDICPLRMNHGPDYNGYSSLLSDRIDQEEIISVFEANEKFIGIQVKPICKIGLIRMARARKLGVELADKLMKMGAKDLLLKARNEASVNNYVMSAKTLENLCQISSSN